MLNPKQHHDEKSQMNQLKVNKIQKSYRQRDVVRGVSLTVKSGEVVGLLGPNGAGKTTIFYMIVGLISPNKGTVKLNHDDITMLPMHKRAHQGLAYLPQESSIFRKLTVEENIMAILELRKNLNEQARHEKCEHLLNELNLKAIRDTLGISLSGGERRRVEIARTLALDPKFILLDEPFAGIDPISIQELKAIIQQLCQKDIGILITDHNFRDTLAICHNAYIINQGKVIAHGLPKTIIHHEEVQNVYLGKQQAMLSVEEN
jgi:lipopolysaccharide export system ATP-binding protein